MAEVIKEGEKLNWEEKARCNSCGTEMKVSADDLMFEPDRLRPSFNPGKFYVECSGCKQRVYFKNNGDIPAHVRAKALEKYDLIITGKWPPKNNRSRNLLLVILIILSVVMLYFSLR